MLHTVLEHNIDLPISTLTQTFGSSKSGEVNVAALTKIEQGA